MLPQKAGIKMIKTSIYIPVESESNLAEYGWCIPSILSAVNWMIFSDKGLNISPGLGMDHKGRGTKRIKKMTNRYKNLFTVNSSFSRKEVSIFFAGFST